MSCCYFAIIASVIFLVTVTVSTKLYVICRHFIGFKCHCVKDMLLVEFFP